MDDCRTLFKNLVGVRLGAPGGRKLGDRNQVFDAVRNALQWLVNTPVFEIGVGIVNDPSIAFNEQASERVVLRSEGLQPLRKKLDEFLGRYLAIPERGA